MARSERAMGRGGGVFLAGMGAGGEPARPRVDLGAEARQLVHVGEQRSGRRFEIADGTGAARAEFAEPRRLIGILRQAEGEAFEQRRDQPGKALPALIRTL